MTPYENDFLAVQTVGAVIASNPGLHHVLRAVIHEMLNLLRVEECIIFQWNEKQNTVSVLSKSGSPTWSAEPPAPEEYDVADFPLIQYALQERRSRQLNLRQVEADSVELARMRREDIKSLLALPMECQDRMVGVIQVAIGQVERTFAMEEIALAQLLANQTACIIENARLFQAEQSRRQELEVFQHVSLSVTASLDLSDVFDAILSAALELVTIDHAHIFLYDAEKLTFGAMMSRDGRHDQPVSEPRPRGLTYTVARRGEPIIISDTSSHPLYADTPAGWHGAIIGIPLKIGERVVGVMNTFCAQPYTFSEGELRTLRLLADQAAIAIENARLYAEMDRRTQQLGVLHELDRAVSASLHLTDIYHTCARHAARLINFDYISINLLEDDEICVVYATDRAGTSIPVNSTLPLRYSAAGWVITQGQPLLRHNIAAESHFAENEQLAGLGIQSVMIIPLRHKREVIGAWQIGSRQLGIYSPDDVEMAQTIADQLANAIENARLYKQAQQEINERKQLEEQFLQAQKMEAVGRLAGGVAHDFNNLLTVINGYSELLLHRYLEDTNPLRRYIEEIQKAGERASSLTGQLLAFSRKQVLQPKVLDLNEVVAELNKMLRRLIGEDIDLVTLPQARSGRVKADPGQIEQVILNLAVNARDAMPEGGKLTIETANVILDEAFTRRIVGLEPGSYVVLRVQDTGLGMEPEILAHIFEPFFTTKDKQKGTGLGLATVYGIVAQSGGHIEVSSEVGQGTTFKIYLPQVDQAVELSQPEQFTDAPHGNETILLVEDEDAVRALTRAVLLKHGYQVLEAARGHEALSLSQQYEGIIDLLATDVVMPQMSGRELAERLSLLRPNIKILYMSGYTEDAIVHHGIFAPGVAFLQKPFSPNGLAHKVREVLDA